MASCGGNSLGLVASCSTEVQYWLWGQPDWTVSILIQKLLFMCIETHILLFTFPHSVYKGFKALDPKVIILRP